METPLPYSAAGQGIPLLLIHGFPHDRSAWAPQLERLSEHAHVIAVDLRAAGLAAGPDRKGSPFRLIETAPGVTVNTSTPASTKWPGF